MCTIDIRFVCQSIRQSVGPFVSSPICRSTGPSVSWSVCQLVCLSVDLFVSPSGKVLAGIWKACLPACLAFPLHKLISLFQFYLLRFYAFIVCDMSYFIVFLQTCFIMSLLLLCNAMFRQLILADSTLMFTYCYR